MSIAAAAPAALRAAVIAGFAIAVEWARVLAARDPRLAAAALVLGGLALGLTAAAYPPARLGLGTSRLPARLLGGLALGIVLLLPAAARSPALPILPAALAGAALLVSVGEEVAFRGALYAALEDLGGARLAVAGSTLAFVAAHALSHPPAFLVPVAAAGLLLAAWRWAARDLVAPILGHVLADLAL